MLALTADGLKLSATNWRILRLNGNISDRNGPL